MFDFEKKQSGEISVNEAVIAVRKEIGTLPDLTTPTEEQVRSQVEHMYAEEPVHVQEKIITAFLQSEAAAAEMADDE